MINLKDKKVLITGATGGIGRCLVKKFSEFDSNILATGTNVEKLSILKNNFKNIYTETFKLDEHKKIEQFIEIANEKLGGLDILVNNAGITLDNLSIRLTDRKLEKSFRYKLNIIFFDV